MTGYELLYLLAEPFLPVLYSRVRGDLRRLVAETRVRNAAPGVRPRILDIGGRNSPYTIGLRADVTVLDKPQVSQTEQALHLGLTDDSIARLRRRRSNIKSVTVQDMLSCNLPPASFDGVVCVEVLEHVHDDERFLEQAGRILKPNGWLLMTTPNGDYIKNEPPDYNPDHVRHYTRNDLRLRLRRYFERVRVVYGVRTGKYRFRGLKSLSARRPLATLESMFCNVVNRLESRGLDAQRCRTAHLFATARDSVPAKALPGSGRSSKVMDSASAS